MTYKGGFGTVVCNLLHEMHTLSAQSGWIIGKSVLM